MGYLLVGFGPEGMCNREHQKGPSWQSGYFKLALMGRIKAKLF